MLIHSFIYFNVFFVCIYFHVSYSLCLRLSFIYSLMYWNIYKLGFIILYALLPAIWQEKTTRTTDFKAYAYLSYRITWFTDFSVSLLLRIKIFNKLIMKTLLGHLHLKKNGNSKFWQGFQRHNLGSGKHLRWSALQQ